MENGIKQSPFSDAACDAPGASGGSHNAGQVDAPGPNGIVQSPMTPLFTGSTSPTPSGDLGQPGPDFDNGYGISAGESFDADITSSRNTVDKR